MVGRAATILLWFAAAASGLSAAAPQTAEQGRQALTALRAVRVADADACEKPEPGDRFCGFVNGACVYCPEAKPHYCPSTDMCYAKKASAKSACGLTYLVCAAPPT
jgi:hypothetical protein